MGGPSFKSLQFWRVLLLVLANLSSGILGAAITAAPQLTVQANATLRSETASDDGQDSNASNQANPTPKDGQAGTSLVIAPLPISSPALGSGIVPALAYIFPLSKSDKSSPPSLVGAVGLVTDNGSSGFVVGGEFYFRENTYRATAVFVRGNLNYDLYGLGAGRSQPKLPLNQTGQAVFAEFLRRLGWKFFLGPRFFWGNSLVTRRTTNSGTAPLPPDLGLQTSLTALGLRLQRDTRPNRFYPTSGSLLDFTADFFSQTLGSKYSLQTYKLDFSKYGSLGDKQVVAYNGIACFTGGQPPFYGNCIYGTNNQLRGYIAGSYLDRYMFATQLEYRLSLPWRLGVAAFAGLGEVVPGGNQLFNTKNFLPSAGGGTRFVLSKKYHVNLRLDFAKGKGSNTWSVGVGEAF